VTRPWNQPYASRNGRAIRSAATSKGRSTEAAVFWTPWTRPPDVSRNDAVISASDTSTSTTTTARRLNGEREREVNGDEAGRRRTEESSTAKPRVRFRVRVATS
jgi:hypothetical protein